MPVFIVIGVGMAVAVYRKFFRKFKPQEKEIEDEEVSGADPSESVDDQSYISDFEIFELHEIQDLETTPVENLAEIDSSQLQRQHNL